MTSPGSWNVDAAWNDAVFRGDGVTTDLSVDERVHVAARTCSFSPSRSRRGRAPLRPMLGSADWRDQIRDLLLRRPTPAGPAVDYAPSPSPFMNPARRAGGAALTNYLNQERTPESSPGGRIDETKVLELEVYENGGVRLFCGRGTVVMHEDTVVVFEALVLGLVHHMVATSHAFAEETGHFAGYDFAIALTGLRGAVSHERAHGLAPSPAPYTNDSYRQVTRASATEIATRPGTVVGRLLGPLMRSLDVADHPRFGQYLTDE